MSRPPARPAEPTPVTRAGGVPEEVLVVGHSMLPKGTASHNVGGILSIVVIVDTRTHRVAKGSISLTTDTARGFVENLLVGQVLTDDPSPFVDVVQQRYWGPGQRAIVQCFRDMQRRYLEVLAGGDAAK